MGEEQEAAIRVLIVDDHPLFRSGLQRAMELVDDIEVIAVSEDGESAMETARRLQPDVILLDVNLPDINGLQVARRLESDYEGLSIVILTAHHDTEQLLHAMRTGADAYCPKDIHADSLIDIIRDVNRGLYVVEGQRLGEEAFQEWLEQRIDETTGPYTIDNEGHYIPLSPRETEILEHVTYGMINKEIASKLGISQQTVKNHMTSILRKLNVKDRTQAAVMALRRGWVRIDDDEDEEEI